MKYLFSRMTIPVFSGFVFGLFFVFSCTTIEQTETQQAPPSTTEEFDTQLTNLDRQIEDNPDDTQLRIQKADLLVQFAKSHEDPSQRTPIYQNLSDVVASVSYRTNNGDEKLGKILTAAWGEEQSSGMRLLQQNESESIDTHFNDIISHFANAITIIPDSLVTYNLKATTYYRNGSLNEAIKTLESATSIAEPVKPELSEKLAYLYLESGRLDESVQLYRELAENHPNDDHIMHGLVNAYILNEQHKEAAELLQTLSDKYPSRYNYQEALATELYFIFEKEAGQLLADPDSDPQTDTKVEQLLNQLEEIQSRFDSIHASLPSNEENTYRMAAFYKKSSAKLREISGTLLLADETNVIVEELEKNHLEQSLPYWERLVEINSDNLEYLIGLQSVYERLEMEEEAESIERSINF
jgi:hypothetical protein